MIIINKKVFKNHANGYCALNPICPKFNSKKFIKYGFIEKIVHDKEIKPFKIRLQRYKCKNLTYFTKTKHEFITRFNLLFALILKDYAYKGD